MNNRIKILFIDDIPDIHIILKALIKESFPDAILLTALDGENGLKIALDENPDVILLDISLPGMDGFEVCRKLKADEWLAEIPVLFLTGERHDQQNRVMALEVGGEAFLTKPFEKSELIAQVRAMLSIRAARRAARNENERLENLIDERTNELKLTENDLRISEDRFRALSEYSHNAICIVDENGKVTWANPKSSEISGYSISQILKKESFISFIAPESVTFVINNFNKFRAGEMYEHYYQFWFVHANGNKRLFEKFMTDYCDKNGSKYLLISMLDVTEKILAEKLLQESEERYRNIFNNAVEGIYQTTPDGRYRTVNLAFARMFGFDSPDEMISTVKSIGAELYVNPADRARLLSLAKESDGMVKNYEVELYKRDKSPFWVSINTRMMLDAETNEIYLEGTCMDITDRIHAGQALRQSEFLLMSLTNTAQDAILMIDPQGKISFWNPAAERIFGHTRSEAIGQDLHQLIAPQRYHEFHQMAFPQFLNSGQGGAIGKTIELEAIKKDGTEISVELSLSAMSINNHWHAVGILRDISERKKTAAHLRDSEERYRNMFENNPQPMLIYDLENLSLMQVNQAAINHYGYSKEEFLSMTLKDIRPAEDLPKLLDELEHLKSGNNSPTEWRHLKKNGEIIIVEIVAHSVTFNDRAARHVLINDITKRKLAEEELMKAKDRAEESDQLKTAFLNNISHEIRTPFNGILGFLSFLKEDDLSAEDRNEYIGIINRSADRLINTINDIVEISKIQTGETKVNLRDIQITGLTDDLCNRFKMEASYKGLKFNFISAISNPNSWIKTDEEKLNAILTSLLNNAIKFTKEGAIEFGMSQHEKSLEFYVKDTGIGIPEQKYDAIFERFTQADASNTRKFEGSGLGLSIAKAFVEMIGGNLWFESKVGSGTTFYVQVPWLETDNESATKIITSPETQIAKPQQFKILVAEDDEDNFYFIQAILNRLNHQSLHANTGNDVLTMLQRDPDIALILMDIRMPDMDGYTATREIRKFNATIPVIAITAYALTGDREKALAAGCNDYLSKPVKKEELLNVLTKYLS